MYRISPNISIPFFFGTKKICLELKSTKSTNFDLKHYNFTFNLLVTYKREVSVTDKRSSDM